MHTREDDGQKEDGEECDRCSSVEQREEAIHHAGYMAPAPELGTE